MSGTPMLRSLLQACAAMAWLGVAAANSLPAELDQLVREAEAEGLPVQALSAKVREGMAKGVPPQTLIDASRTRLQAMRKACGMMEQKSLSPMVLECIAQCVESGMPEECLRAVLGHATRESVPQGRLAAALSAGEMAHLAGIAPEDIRAFMLELLVREGNRRDGRRAADRIRQLHAEGHAGEELKKRLWGSRSPTDESRPRPSNGRHQGGGGGLGRGAGGGSPGAGREEMPSVCPGPRP